MTPISDFHALSFRPDQLGQAQALGANCTSGSGFRWGISIPARWAPTARIVPGDSAYARSARSRPGSVCIAAGTVFAHASTGDDAPTTAATTGLVR